jgi:hypothetical protein
VIQGQALDHYFDLYSIFLGAFLCSWYYLSVTGRLGLLRNWYFKEYCCQTNNPIS